ncbi:transmembrane protein [Thalictrum thalictroides]|uniref:Transmembrane protein n=1 Tax=Thalictrum thalictroides TaxID=46969 RepID=A0A7J6W9B0_THATH|nr:transmembrane protein [Thalictrum thalictroides]
MVCLACLLPLFFIPIINALPLLFDFLMGKLYRVMGWEYKKPERVAPACPYKPPVASSDNMDTKVSQEPDAPSPILKTGPVDDDKLE